MSDKLLNTTEAARKLGVSVSHHTRSPMERVTDDA